MQTKAGSLRKRIRKRKPHKPRHHATPCGTGVKHVGHACGGDAPDSEDGYSYGSAGSRQEVQAGTLLARFAIGFEDGPQHDGCGSQIAGQKRTIRRLSRVIAVLALLLLGMGVTMFLLLRGGTQPKPGQNYSAVTKPTEDPTVPTTGPDSSS